MGEGGAGVTALGGQMTCHMEWSVVDFGFPPRPSCDAVPATWSHLDLETDSALDVV